MKDVCRLNSSTYGPQLALKLSLVTIVKHACAFGHHDKDCLPIWRWITESLRVLHVIFAFKEVKVTETNKLNVEI